VTYTYHSQQEFKKKFSIKQQYFFMNVLIQNVDEIIRLHRQNDELFFSNLQANHCLISE